LRRQLLDQGQLKTWSLAVVDSLFDSGWRRKHDDPRRLP
jgi:hypothetical protein